MSPKHYYVLVTLEPVDNTKRWTVQFGDYNRDVCYDEGFEYEDDGHTLRWKVIKVNSDTQHAIDDAVAKLNAKFA